MNTTTFKKAEYLSQVITVDNIITLSEQTAKKALRTVCSLSKDLTASRMLKDLIKDIHNKGNHNHAMSAAYELAQIASTFYCEYIGQPLTAITKDELTRDKQPIDIYRACIRAVNREIYQARTKEYKTIYLHDIDENKLVAVPKKWDMPTITDLNKVNQAIENMNLSPNEYRVLAARLRGDSLRTIAKELNCPHNNLACYLKRIRNKAAKIGIMPKTTGQAIANA